MSAAQWLVLSLLQLVRELWGTLAAGIGWTWERLRELVVRLLYDLTGQDVTTWGPAQWAAGLLLWGVVIFGLCALAASP